MSLLIRTIKQIATLSFSKTAGISNNSNVLSSVDITQRDHGVIICFVGGSMGDALANLTRETIGPLGSKAQEVLVIDLNSPDWNNELVNSLRKPIWFVYSYFALGQAINIEIEGRLQNLWEFYRIPFIRVYGDTPAYFPDRHVSQYSNSINVYGSRAHRDFYRRWFDARAVSVIVPPTALDRTESDKIDEEAKAKGKIVFLKNGNSPDLLIDYWRKSLPHSIAKCLESVGEQSTSKSNIDNEPFIDDLIISYFDEVGIDISSDRMILCFLVAQIDDYLRRVKSTLIAEAISDLPVLISGFNWGHLNLYGKRAQLDPSMNYKNSRALIDAAPALIDMSPNIVDAPHDRVCRAAGRKTAFLTNKQIYLSKFVVSPERCSFNFNKQSIHDLVEHYVSNPRDAIQLGLTQAQGFREHFTTEKYCSAYFSVIDTLMLRLGGRPQGTQDFVDFPSKNF